LGTSDRRGAAVAELAVCLPLLALVVFGSIQACNIVYLKHGVTTAAYEGTLELAKRSATNASVTARVQQVLDARGVSGATIRILPAGSDVSATAQGTALSVEVVAKVAPNMSLSKIMPTPPEVTSRIVGTR
jgi:Flp pilus assembly protein TadG